MSATNYNKKGVLIRNNTIYVQGMVDGKFTRKSTKKKATKANIKWAENNAHDILLQLVSNIEPVLSAYTVEEFGLMSLKMNAAKRKENTIKGYKKLFDKNIVPYFKDRKLSSLKVSDLKLWQLALSKRGLSPKSIKNNRGVFNYILKDAFADDLIKKNFFQFVEVIPLVEPVIHPFNLEEMNRLIKNANGWFKNYITLAFLTGLRTGEILGLRWCDVDLDEGVINITQAVSDGVVSTPKTKAHIMNP